MTDKTTLTLDFESTIVDGFADPEALADEVAAAIRQAPGAWEDHYPSGLAGVGAPPLDLVVTPMTARAALLGMRDGKAFYHHELRRRLPMPPELEPTIDVWDGGTVPIWQDGVLEEPKYFSFFQEAPLASFNPNHRRKWRAHELLHGAVGFFWRPDLTRFESYLSARLNELLPVVHWYGFDEMFRPRCERHRSEILYRDGCVDCEAAATPFWEQSIDDDARESAVAFARTANEHFRREMEACWAEIETGAIHETPRGRLDASSDAVGYLESHWNRMTAWSFGAWLERFLVEGVDYVSSTRKLAERVTDRYVDLVSGPLSVDLKDFRAQRDRRVAQDIAYRVYLALEWVDPGSAAGEAAEAALEPLLEVLAETAEGLMGSRDAGFEGVWEQVREAFDDARPHLPEGVGSELDALGLRFGERDAVRSELTYVAHGLATALPAIFEQIEQPPIAAFVASEYFDENGLVARRFADFMQANEHELAELARFEAWTLQPPRRDRAGELFGALVDEETDLGAGELRLNTTWRRRTFPTQPLESVLGLEGSEVDLAAYIWRGELRIVVVEPAVEGVLGALESGEMPDDFATVMGLVAEGALVWLPTAR